MVPTVTIQEAFQSFYGDFFLLTFEAIELFVLNSCLCPPRRLPTVPKDLAHRIAGLRVQRTRF